MKKKCDLCGKSASFLDGGGKFKDKTLCFDCYDEAANKKTEDELTAMGFKDEVIEKHNNEWGLICALRTLAWIDLIFSIILTIQIWSEVDSFLIGFKNLLNGAIIFIVLYVFSHIALNISAIMENLNSRNIEK